MYRQGTKNHRLKSHSANSNRAFGSKGRNTSNVSALQSLNMVFPFSSFLPGSRLVTVIAGNSLTLALTSANCNISFWCVKVKVWHNITWKIEVLIPLSCIWVQTKGISKHTRKYSEQSKNIRFQTFFRLCCITHMHNTFLFLLCSVSNLNAVVGSVG